MVAYKVLRVTDNGGSISVVVQITNSGKIAPICFNPASFEQMTPEEIDQSIAEMVEQMFGRDEILATATGEISESKVVKIGKYFDTDKEEKPIRDSKPKAIKPMGFKEPKKLEAFTHATYPENEKPK